MSEVMTSEAIIEAEWLLEGHWSKPRFAFQSDNGAWSDVDVLAYHPKTKHLVISESKVQGQKDMVFAYTKSAKNKYGTIDKYDGNKYFSFLRHLPILCRDGVIFSDDVKFKEMVNSMTIQLVCNYVITSDVKEEVEKTLKSMIPHDLPIRMSQINFQLDSTIDVFARVIQKERISGQNKRYGNPVLDIAREINRYFFPKIRNAGKEAKLVRKEAVAKFLEAIGIKC